jgi:hypothetical protein
MIFTTIWTENAKHRGKLELKYKKLGQIIKRI